MLPASEPAATPDPAPAPDATTTASTTSPAAEPGSFFGQAIDLWPLLALGVGLVFLAVAINVLVPSRRPHLRRVVVMLLFAILAWGTKLGVMAAGFAGPTEWLLVVAKLLTGFTLVNLLGVTLFDLVLPRLKIGVSAIVSELVVAAGWVLVCVVVLTTSGIELTGVFAISTVAAAIFTFSLQATLGNVLGGMAVQFDGSIRAGDWLQLENGRQGRVREIRWRFTTLETRDGDLIIVPNSMLLSSLIILMGKRGDQNAPHRMSVDFYVDALVPADRVVTVVETTLRGSPIENVVAFPLADCVCLDLGARNPGFILYSARVWILDLGPDAPTTSVVRTRIHTALRRADIQLGAPTVGVYSSLPDGDQARSIRQRNLDRARGMLDRVALFQGLTRDERDHIAKNLLYAPFGAGEIITRQGAVAHWLYLLGDGQVRVVTSVDGTEQVVAEIEAPGFFGEMGLMTGEPRLASVVATSEVECWRLEKSGFDEILRNRPEIAVGVSELLAKRRVELAGIREGLDHATRRARESAERAKILDRIQVFFGLL